MRFEGIDLTNVRCFAEAAVTFEPGVTVVHGPNGSGKSSLLDACFFALYGADTLEGKTLDELITTGASSAAITLTFAHDGASYALDRELRIRGDRAETTTCELRGGSEVIDGARAVKEEIARLLRMDANAFLNCAYVRQGEVNKLINARPSERQDMIDELLQLGVLEEYRDRATAARRGIATVRDEVTGTLAGVEAQIAEKEEKDLPGKLHTLESKKTACESEIADLREQIEVAESTREAAKEVLNQHEEWTQELEALSEEIGAIRAAIAADESTREELIEQIGKLTDERTSIETTIAEFHANLDISDRDAAAVEQAKAEVDARDEALRAEIESARVALERHRQRAERANERVEELTERVAETEEIIEAREESIETTVKGLEEQREALAERMSTRRNAQEEITSAGYTRESLPNQRKEIEEQLSACQERESELRAKETALTERINEAEELVAAGRCPTCGQTVESAPNVESLEQDREALQSIEEQRTAVEGDRAAYQEMHDEIAALEKRGSEIDQLTTQIESMEELISDREAAIERQREEVESLKKEVEDAAEKAEEAKSDAAKATEQIAAAQTQIGEINTLREEQKERRVAIDALLEAYDRKGEISADIERFEERRNGLDALAEERRNRLAEKRERRRELEANVVEETLETAKAEFKRADEYLSQAASHQEALEADRDELLDRLGRIQAELEELEALQERRKAVESRLQAIKTVHADAEDLEALYRHLRSDLREQNVVILERMLNEMFDLIYQNDAYDRIELDREYRFTVYQKDGEPLAPEQLSGGERALFNLSLRCAIYRLLSEGIEGTAHLPPLILDEPTVFLDAGHVGQLVTLVDAMREIGVEQIILVTHDPELLRAADVTLTVEKDPTTNRSRVQVTPRAISG